MNDDKKDGGKEDAPLKPEQNDTGGSQGGGAGSGDKKGIFSRPRILWCVALSALPLLGGVVLGATLLAGEGQRWDFYTYDSNYTLMEMFPKPNRPRNLLTFRHGSRPHEGREWPELTAQLEGLLQGYHNVTKAPARVGYRRSNVTDCFGNRPRDEYAVCHFDIRPLALECTPAMKFGYELGKPCIIFQFTNHTNWKPEPYSTHEIEMMPQLPDDLRYVYKSNMAYLDCHGDSIIDQENIGPVHYSPEHGFNSKYFPYRGQPDYMAPLVAVLFEKPAVGIAISVTCRLWARNINANGTISFTLLVE